MSGYREILRSVENDTRKRLREAEEDESRLVAVDLLLRKLVVDRELLEFLAARQTIGVLGWSDGTSGEIYMYITSQGRIVIKSDGLEEDEYMLMEMGNLDAFAKASAEGYEKFVGYDRTAFICIRRESRHVRLGDLLARRYRTGAFFEDYGVEEIEKSLASDLEASL